MITIEMRPAPDRDREVYGIVLESATRHMVAGRNVHNRSFPHRVRVWDIQSPSRLSQGRDPITGQESDEAYAYLLSAESVAITSTPQPRDPYGDVLVVGEHVRLAVCGHPLEGTFEVRSNRMGDPRLVKVSDGQGACQAHADVHVLNDDCVGFHEVSEMGA